MSRGFFCVRLMESIVLTPIGVVRTGAKYRFEQPRQAAFSEADGMIELLPAYGGDAVADLAGFDRIWVIFCFHLNLGRPWKPKVRPPVPAGGVCRGLFATRSPYRVNPIGLSCVELLKVERRRLYLRGHDMLDGTPVLDIKPYIPEADAFPDAAVGWREAAGDAPWEVTATALFKAQADFIRAESGLDLERFGRLQLGRAPLDAERKRLSCEPDGGSAIGCRTWRVIFRCDEAARTVTMLEVRSNYAPEELLPGVEDPYRDKAGHREFLAVDWNRWNEA